MYRQAIVTFIDILGFRELINKGTATDIKNTLNLLHKFAARGTDNENDLEPKVITFSDAVIRIRPVDTDLNEYSPFGLFFFVVAYLNLHALDSLTHFENVDIVAVDVGEDIVDKTKHYLPSVAQGHCLIAAAVVASIKALQETRGADGKHRVSIALALWLVGILKNEFRGVREGHVMHRKMNAMIATAAGVRPSCWTLR